MAYKKSNWSCSRCGLRRWQQPCKLQSIRLCMLCSRRDSALKRRAANIGVTVESMLSRNASGFKFCFGCRQWKDAEQDFTGNNSVNDGRESRCKQCYRSRNQQRYHSARAVIRCNCCGSKAAIPAKYKKTQKYCSVKCSAAAARDASRQSFAKRHQQVVYELRLENDPVFADTERQRIAFWRHLGQRAPDYWELWCHHG